MNKTPIQEETVSFHLFIEQTTELCFAAREVDKRVSRNDEFSDSDEEDDRRNQDVDDVVMSDRHNNRRNIKNDGSRSIQGRSSQPRETSSHEEAFPMTDEGEERDSPSSQHNNKDEQNPTGMEEETSQYATKANEEPNVMAE
jgi:hypothetical protein